MRTENTRNRKGFTSGIIVMIIIIMFGTILIKLALGFFNYRIAKEIDSSLVKGTALDSIVDAVITTITIISVILSEYINFPIDGVMGLITAVWIFIVACNLAEENANYILGKQPDDKVLEEIGKIIMKYKVAKDYYGLIIHDYGHENIFATVNVLIQNENNIDQILLFIKQVCTEILEEYNIKLTIQIEN
jgi:divalent metal cation (Fe/Co/Zn/Cd) transporter